MHHSFPAVVPQTNMTGDKFQTPLNDGLLLNNSEYKFYRVDLDGGTWGCDFTEQEEQPEKVVFEDMATWLKEISAKTDARYFRAGNEIDQELDIGGKVHSLWNGITDQKGTKLVEGQQYSVPLKSFPIVHFNSSKKRSRTSDVLLKPTIHTKVFFMQNEKAPQGGSHSIYCRFVGLAVPDDSTREAGGQDILSHPVSDGFLVVDGCLPLRKNSPDRFYLRLDGALRDVRPFKYAEKLKDMQAMMPFANPLANQVEIKDIHGNWQKVSDFSGDACQHLSFSRTQSFIPDIRIPFQNRKAVKWSMASQEEPMYGPT